MGSGAAAGWIELAVVGRAHGVRGEVYVRPLNAESDLLASLPTLRRDGERGDELRVERARQTPQGWLVRFEGVADREAAAALTNCKLYIERAALPALDEDEVYQTDLVGARVLVGEGEDEVERGIVRGFFFNGAHDVLVLDAGGREALLPFHDGVLVDFDLDEGWVRLDLPGGIPGLDDDVEDSA